MVIATAPVDVAPLTETEVSGAIPPTTPVKTAFPATVRANGLFTVPKVTVVPVSVLLAPNNTAPVYNCAPVVVTRPPFRAAPAAVEMLRLPLPSTVPAKVIPAPVLVSVLAPIKDRGPWYVWEPELVTEPPLITIAPPVSVVREPSGPTAPAKVVVPVEFSVRFLPTPLTAPPKVSDPDPVESVVSPVKVTPVPPSPRFIRELTV